MIGQHFENKKAFLQKLVWFIIHPFSAAIHSLFNIHNKASRVFLYLWFVLFGLAFTPKNPNADSFRYAENFVVQSQYSDFDYKVLIQSIYDRTESREMDVYTLSVNHFIGKITKNYHIVTMFYAIIFGLFYILCLSFYARYKIPDNEWFLVIIFLVCFSNPIFNINGVRFWTASWIAVFIIFKVFVEADKRYIPLSFLTILIHGSFGLFIGLLFIGLFLKGSEKLWLIFFFISFFFSLPIQTFGIEDYLPLIVKNKIDFYAEKEMANLPTYALVLNYLPRLYSYILLIILCLKTRPLSQREKQIRRFVLFWFCFVNATRSIASVGVRFYQIIIPILAYLWLIRWHDLKSFKNLVYMAPLFYSYKILYWIRNMISISEGYVYIAPLPITVWHYLFE